MEQLQKDRNYTGFLCRLIEQEMKTGKFRNKNELIAFINKINSDLATVELGNYIRNNGLSFNSQEFSMNVNRILEEYDRIVLMQNTVTPFQQPTQQPIQNVGQVQQVNNVQNQPVNNIQSITEQQEKYVPITKIDFNSVSQNLIEKVNFLIVNPSINTNDFMVDLVSGNFKNIKDNNIYVVTKNNNNSLSMVSDIELQNMVGNPNISDVNRKAIMEEIARRKQIVSQADSILKTDSPKTKVKVKHDKKKIVPEINNSAFASTVLLTVMSAIFGIVIATILLAS